MLIHLARASDTAKSTVRRSEILSLHALSTSRQHELTEDPDAAEMIVLAGDLESLAEARANQLLRRFPEKTMAYSEIDALVPYVPGVYASAAKPHWFNLNRTQSSIYLSRYGSSRNPAVRHRPSIPKELLFCFLGRRDCRVRENILAHHYNRPDVLVLERTGYMHWNDGVVGEKQAQEHYADTIMRSHFALCPRGMGFGSIRLFEVMEMGVAPVLLADGYALPPGPDWSTFLLRVPEREYRRLPEILAAHKAESADRGHRARLAWEQFFAPHLVFDRLIEQLCTIRRRRFIPERLYRQIWPLLHLRRDIRSFALTARQQVSQTVKQTRGAKQSDSTSAITDTPQP